jgi:hypothetical protein
MTLHKTMDWNVFAELGVLDLGIIDIKVELKD